MQTILKLVALSAASALMLMLAACSSDKIYFPPEKPAPVSTAITASPYLSNGIYVCPIPLAPIPTPSQMQQWIEQWQTPPLIPPAKPSRQSAQDLSQFLCNHGVVIYWVGDSLNIVVPSDIIFYTNNSALRYKANPILNRVAALINKYNANPVNISVFTDTLLPKQQALALTQGQANSVKTYLWGQNVPMQHMRTNGFGSGFQVGSVWTQAGNAENRRVEINMLTNNSQS